MTAVNVKRSDTGLRRSALFVAQALATIAVLALVPGNAPKLVTLLTLWALTFVRLSSREAIAYVCVCVLFSVMDAVAVRRGLFAFLNPDFAGLPAWELFMWGFYTLHMLRLLDGPKPSGSLRAVLPLAVLFSLPFSLIEDPVLLLAASGFMLAIALLAFHERWDLVYAGYALLLGAAVEYAGVWSGQWSYPGDPPGGVAPWFATMWAGVGLFIRRLALPFMR